MKVRDIMTKDLTSIEKEISVKELIFILNSSGTTSVPVVDDEEKLIGFISESDIIKAALPGYFELLDGIAFIPDMNQLSKKLVQIEDDAIEKYMQREVVWVYDDDDDLQVADMMIRKNIRNIPVVNREGHLVGVVTRINLVQQLL
ncbi:CBS domain-containing protein [Candidatus Bipolaricaulota bacterium]|nr:CBS domain-containing protein [Candidatus Bipolaricaulota bacterium]HBR09864.1 hypothetical protein [Candidatus Acetothermia bacterium]